MSPALFRDRTEAGRLLGRLLAGYRGSAEPLVLALPRGGVPVGFEVARELAAPLDLFLVRKLGLPEHPELAMGAIASGGVLILNDALIEALGVEPEELDPIVHRELAELERRRRVYRGDLAPPHVSGRTVIVVDDGMATGSSMRAAVAALRAQRPRRIVAAVPVGSRSACAHLQDQADELICAYAPETFHTVAQYYADFSQIRDAEVRELLRRAAAELPEKYARDALG